MNCIKCNKQLPWAIERLGKDLCYKCWEKVKRTRKWYRYEDEFIIIH